MNLPRRLIRRLIALPLFLAVVLHPCLCPAQPESGRPALRPMLTDRAGLEEALRAEPAGLEEPAESEAIQREILAVLPEEPVGDSREEEAAWIARRFGTRWREALSLMGGHLLDPGRRPVVEEVLSEDLTLARTADLLNYRDYVEFGVRFETFPPVFRKLVYDHARTSRGVSGQDLDALWAVYAAVHRDWAQGLDRSAQERLGELQRDTARWTHESVPGLIPSPARMGGWSDRKLVTHTLEVMRRFARPGTYQGLERNERVERVWRGAEGSSLFEHLVGRVAGGVYEGQRVFSAWISDPGLLDQIVRSIPKRELDRVVVQQPLLGRPALPVGSIYYREVDAQDPTLQVEVLQAWLRLSDRHPEPLRRAIGPIEESLERAFRAYAAQEGFRRILAPSGSRLLATAIAPIHPNTVERLNRLFMDAGYELVHRDGGWWWQRDLESGLEEVGLEALEDSVVNSTADRARLLDLLRMIRADVEEALPSYLERSARDPRFSFVARDGSGRIIGVAIARREKDPSVLYLSALGVDQERRRQGIGRRLVEAVIRAGSEAGSIRRLALETHGTNGGSREFYRALGFTEVGAQDRLGNLRLELRVPPVDSTGLEGPAEKEPLGEAILKMGQLFDPASDAAARADALKWVLDRVVEPLSRTGDPGVLELIPDLRRILLMEDPGLSTSDELRRMAGEGLAIIGDPSALPAFRDALAPPGGPAWVSSAETRQALVEEIPKFQTLLPDQVNAVLFLLTSVADADPDEMVRRTAELVLRQVEPVLTAALGMWDLGLDPSLRLEALRELQAAVHESGETTRYEWIFYRGWDEEPDPEISLGRMSVLVGQLQKDEEEAATESDRAFLQRRKAALRTFVVRMRQRHLEAAGKIFSSRFIAAVDRALRFLAEPVWLELGGFDMTFGADDPSLRAAVKEAGQAGAARLLLIPLREGQITLWPYFFGFVDMEDQVRAYLDRPVVRQLAKYGLRFAPLSSARADPALFQRPGLLIVDRRRPPGVPLAPRQYAVLDAQDLLGIHPALAAAQALHPEMPLELLKAQVVGWLVFEDQVTGALYLAVLA